MILKGTAGGFAAMTTFYPLDNLRVRVQVNENSKLNSLQILQKLIEEEGVGALYRGLGPVLISLACSNFVFVFLFIFLTLSKDTFIHIIL